MMVYTHWYDWTSFKPTLLKSRRLPAKCSSLLLAQRMLSLFQNGQRLATGDAERWAVWGILLAGVSGQMNHSQSSGVWLLTRDEQLLGIEAIRANHISCSSVLLTLRCASHTAYPPPANSSLFPQWPAQGSRCLRNSCTNTNIFLHRFECVCTAFTHSFSLRTNQHNN